MQVLSLNIQLKALRFLKIAIFAGLGLLFSLGCSSTFNPEIKRGTTYEYKEGYPEIRLSAYGSFDENYNTKLNIIAEVVYGSLIFKRKGDKRIAEMSIELRIFDLGDGKKVIKSTRFSFDQEIDDPNLTQSQDDLFTLRRQLDISPGTYEVELSVIDQTTGRRATRVYTSSVPDPDRNESTITNITLEGKDLEAANTGWSTITTYDIPGKIDSLRLTYNMINRAENSITIDSRLVRFASDTSYATPMNQNFGNTSLTFDAGIQYNKKELIKTYKRTLGQQGNVTIEFYLGKLERGNYRFEVNAKGDEDNEPYKAREFSIKSKNYPILQSADELARPLVYIMGNKEYREMMSIKDKDSLKQAIDRFWLKNVGSTSDAKSVLRLYYERVEAANKKYGNFKEGWKTDRGMVYILFGTPLYETEYQQSVEWGYTYNRSDPSLNFEFTRVRNKSKFFPFDYYVLRRRSFYYSTLYRQKQLWLSGQILVRKL